MLVGEIAQLVLLNGVFQFALCTLQSPLGGVTFSLGVLQGLLLFLKFLLGGFELIKES